MLLYTIITIITLFLFFPKNVFVKYKVKGRIEWWLLIEANQTKDKLQIAEILPQWIIKKLQAKLGNHFHEFAFR